MQDILVLKLLSKIIFLKLTINRKLVANQQYYYQQIGQLRYYMCLLFRKLVLSH